MGKRARWVLIGVVLLAVVGVGWMKARRVSEPIARWALADGTELRLQYVTYGMSIASLVRVRSEFCQPD